MPQCPLCPFEDDDSYALTFHVEVVHFGQDSPFVVRDETDQRSSETAEHDFDGHDNRPDDETAGRRSDAQSAEKSQDEESHDGGYLPCPEDDCGEQVLWHDMQEHLDFHLAERLGLDGETETLDSRSPKDTAAEDKTKLDPKRRKRSHASSGSSSGRSTLARRSKPASSFEKKNRGARMGKAELGPFAFEAQMPSWLRKLLLEGARRTTTQRLTPTGKLYRTTEVENEVGGIIPVLADLLVDDLAVQTAWLCHSSVQHIFKLPKEGGFCGYRNIQMMMSFMLGTHWKGWDAIAAYVAEQGKSKKDQTEAIPNVFQLQDMIERGWDLGFGSQGRIETGGIKGTRKYIGTPEFQSLLASFHIPCAVFICTDKIYAANHENNQKAHEALLDEVQSYFCGKTSPSDSSIQDSPYEVVHCTDLPPLYLQQPGHSMTVIGIELCNDGKRNLLVFDPAYKTSDGIRKLLGVRTQQQSASTSPRKSQVNKTARVQSSKALKSTSKISIDDSSTASISSSATRDADGSRGGFAADKASTGRSERKRRQAVLLLEAYRRGSRNLGRHKEFEMLRLSPAST